MILGFDAVYQLMSMILLVLLLFVTMMWGGVGRAGGKGVGEKKRGAVCVGVCGYVTLVCMQDYRKVWQCVSEQQRVSAYQLVMLACLMIGLVKMHENWMSDV